MKPLSRAALWAIWFALVFGALNLYGPSLWSYQPEGGRGAMTQQEIAERMTPLQLLGVLLRSDSDTGRYLSYANAILGRPYAAYYVRPLTQWTKAEDEDAANRSSAMVAPERPLLPWRDFSVEYPPGMLICALLPALFTADKDVYHFLFSVEMGLLLTLSVWLTTRTAERVAPGLGREALLTAILFVAGLGVISLRRYDAALTLALSATIAALVARKPFASGIALAVGVVVKGVPVLLAPIGLAWFVTKQAWAPLARSVAGAGAVLLATVAAYLFLAGPHAFDALLYHGERPLQIESAYGALLIAARFIDPDIATRVYSFGSDNIVSVWEPALRGMANVAPAVALLGVYVWSWSAMRRATDDAARLRALSATVSAALVAFIVLGKISSPQYLVWLLPSGTLAAVFGSRLNRMLLIFACALTQLEYPFAYSALAGDLDPRLGLLALLRDAVLIWWAVLALAEARQESTALAASAARLAENPA